MRLPSNISRLSLRTIISIDIKGVAAITVLNTLIGSITILQFSFPPNSPANNSLSHQTFFLS